MRKIHFFAIFFSFSFMVWGAVPEGFSGIWQGKDRYIFIGENGDFSIVLKLYDGWYFDRASESPGFEKESTRERNAASSKEATIVSADFEEIPEGKGFGTYEMVLKSNGKTFQKIPVALSNDKLYLNFLIHIDGKENAVNGSTKIRELWQGINSSFGIRTSETKTNGNIYSYIILEDSCYRLRYWETNMDFDEKLEASFSDGEKTFTVKRHIFSGGKTFSCTSGRSKKIRNVEKFSAPPFVMNTDSENHLLFLDEADFSRAAEDSKEKLLEIVKEANSRRKPFPPPLFSYQDLDFHWDLIERLEKGNKIIEKLREPKN